MKLNSLARARILLEIAKIANLETTLGDIEIVITGIERILIDEGVIKIKK